MNRIFLVEYKAARIRPFKAYGKYRGSGRIEFSNDGLHISGRHFFPFGIRSGIALGIFFAGWLLATAGKFGLGAVLTSPVYLFISFFFFKRENIVVSYPEILNYVERPKQSLVAIDFKSHKWCAPVVLQSENWPDIMAALREIVPGRDASFTILPPSSAPAAICLSSLVFLGLYLIFFFAIYLAIIFVITSGAFAPTLGLGASIDEMKSENLRIGAWAVTFGMPLLISIIFAITTYKSKRRSSRADGLKIPAAALP